MILLDNTAPITTSASSFGEWVAIVAWVLGILAATVFAVVWRRERLQSRRLEERSRELERLSTELLRVNKMKSEFLANVSHELRTPLNAIVGFVELLREGVYGDLTPRQSAPVERIESSAVHLRHLVDQVLDLAKMAAGRLEVHTELIDLRPFILDVGSEIEPLVAEKGLTLTLDMGGSIPKISTDPTHLRQILVNLLGNAVKYTPQGSITVGARVARKSGANGGGNGDLWVTVYVTDTGIGIAKKDHERIFEEFEQVNSGPRTDSMERGTGLGLPISRKLAQTLGGDLTVESELGKGATFTLWLPGTP